MARWIAGLDGCRGAWAGVLLDLDDPGRHRAALFASVADCLDGPEAPVSVGIDVPIGLPDRASGGGRAADRAARAYLGAGRASVFPVPPRAAVYADSYAAAKALSRENSEPPFAPSIQCFNIFRYVREVDALLRARPDLVIRLHEVHPEIAFRRLNGDRPLAAGKKGPQRLAGLAMRRALLAAAGLPDALVHGERPRGVGADDHLDAMAGLVVARDILLGLASPLPDPPERDAHGLPAVIWMPAPSEGGARQKSCENVFRDPRITENASPPCVVASSSREPESTSLENALTTWVMSDQTLAIRHVARALVFDPADRLLLIEYESVHALGPDGKPARFWFMPGGGLEPGEDHVTACRRELSEEIGVADCAIGPQVAACDGPFHLFRQSRDARERYFLVRLADDRIDTSRLMETEDNPLHGTRWWTVAELLSTEARIEPAGLGVLAERLVAGHVPEAPIILNWQRT